MVNSHADCGRLSSEFVINSSPNGTVSFRVPGLCSVALIQNGKITLIHGVRLIDRAPYWTTQAPQDIPHPHTTSYPPKQIPKTETSATHGMHNQPLPQQHKTGQKGLVVIIIRKKTRAQTTNAAFSGEYALQTSYSSATVRTIIGTVAH